MANKQVQEIKLRLITEGGEGLDKLKSSFRELGKAIGPSNATIEKARRNIIEFGEASDRTEQLIRGQLEAFKGLRSQAEIGSTTYKKLVNSITQLETELRGSSAAIDNQREAILRSTASSEKNADAFRRQIDALKQLQQQTRPGSSAFAQLGRDIDNARGRLTGLASEAQEFSRALNQGFGATPEKLSGQIAALRRGMVGLRFDSEKYLETLERIRLMTITQAGRTGRAEVIAGFQAYQNPTFTGGYASPGRLPELPNTTAALEQQLSELTAELANVERGSARYVDVANRMADIQRELRGELTGTTEAFRKLDIAQAGVERRSEKLAGIQEYYRTQGPLAPGVGGFRDPATGAMIMAGARTPGRIRVEEAAYQTPIGPQPFPEAGRRAQESIQRSLDDVNRIYEDARVRRVEIQSKYDQIQIDKLLEGLELEGRVREKGFRDELAAFDRQLEARDRRRRRRLTAGQAVQAAGAVISGGIFGGAEGSLGGLGGAILGSAVPGLGTVGGAFAGAAIGAQVGMLRQQLGGFADYAAQIQKMQIALENAAGSQSEFNRAMAAATSATQNLNVPQDVAIQGMTKLTAAVKGAGGQVSDAELVFRNVTSAIKATGGSAQDVDGAITAMVQVFSKGKVSAEELSGQLGERLPGAVTKFAKANDMTLPELQKALEQGQVGLNELMNFIVQLGDEYSDVAGQIAASSQDSGARLLIAFNDMKIAVGEALQPIGAQFQEAFIPFIENITPVLIDILPKIGEFALTLAKNFDTLAIAAAAALGVFAVGKIAAIGGIGAALLQLAAAAGAASVSLKALNAAALLNPWTALAAGVAAVGVAFYDAHKEKQRFDEVLRSGTADDLAGEIERLEQKIKEASSKTASYSSDIRGVGNEAGYASIEIRNMRAELENIKGEYKVRLLFEQAGLDPEKGFYTPVGKTKPTPSTFPSLTEDGKGAGKAKKERESQLPQLMAQLALLQQVLGIEGKIRQAQLAGNSLLEIRLEGEKQIAQLAGQIQQLAFEKIPANEVAVKKEMLLLQIEKEREQIAHRLAMANEQFRKETIAAAEEQAKSYIEQVQERNRLEELTSTGMTEALAQEYVQVERIIDLQKEKYEKQIDFLKKIAELGGPGSDVAKTEIGLLGIQIESLDKEEARLKGLAGAAQPEQIGKLQQFIKDAEAELRDLEGMAVRISQNIGNAIGDSIASGITGLIEGTTTAKQVFANFLRDVGQILIREGAKMIATYIAIGIAKAFAGLSSKSSIVQGKDVPVSEMPAGMSFDPLTNFSEYVSPNAKGNTYAQNGIQPFATGGIVTRPTFFKFANGGQMRNGLMGEAGPEAIVPLKRGPDGRLGISMYTASRKAVANTEAMAGATTGDSGYEEEMALGGVSATRRSVAASAAQAVMATRMQVSEQRSISERRSEMRQIQEIVAKPAKINVEFQSQVINNVEYVTREQAERMAAQSALRGRELAIGSLQNSVKTRKRVGMA